MGIWHRISKDRVKPEEFIAVIEIPKGSKTKYEIDEELPMIILDRVLYTSTHYPANYGFIPRTHASDGDPLDVLVLCSEDLMPLSLVKCKPIGMISMIDGEQQDDKIIAVAVADPSSNHYKELSDLPQHMLNEMHHFFEVYKVLEDKSTHVLDISDKKKAQQVIQRSLDTFEKLFLK